MNKEEKTCYEEDQPDPTLNTSLINQIFNTTSSPLVDAIEKELCRSNLPVKSSIDDSIESAALQISEIDAIRRQLKELVSEQSPENILKENIERANRLLDIVETQVNSMYSNRTMEAAAKLLDSVTTAANALESKSYNQDLLKRKDEGLEIRRKEIALKAAIMMGQKPLPGDQIGSVTNNNIIVSSRHELMKIIHEQNQKTIEKGNDEQEIDL